MTYSSDSTAWYSASRSDFVGHDVNDVVRVLAASAVSQGWHVEPEQSQEWSSSLQILQTEFSARAADNLSMLRNVLAAEGLADFHHVFLEYDLKRRGLRLDCVLLAPGLLVVVEFKRSKLGQSDRDQVTNYCVNLVEFHEVTRRSCEQNRLVLAPVLCLTEGRASRSVAPRPVFLREPWDSIVVEPAECDATTLGTTLQDALNLRRGRSRVSAPAWLDSRFAPSSTIIDAAISLYGQHDVSAIAEHQAPAQEIASCTSEIATLIDNAQRSKQRLVVLMSGAPGAGKTLVGLNLAFDSRYRADAVFVTGNAPLVDVLHRALTTSYKRAHSRRTLNIPSGYASEQGKQLIDMTTFKIVKAHRFLGKRGSTSKAADGRVVIFDEAQRTYEKGRMVAGSRLADHEADLILQSLEESYDDGIVVVGLLGQNQAINRGERGGMAWLEAAKRRGWAVAAGRETLRQLDADTESLGSQGHLMRGGHLGHSLRFYRNKGLERWTDAVLEGNRNRAVELAGTLHQEGHTVWITRDLQAARAWVRSRRVGVERAGVIASAQARRLIADGLHVGMKPDIADWMLAPTGDIRSSNMLETVQNQFQIQGLELDYALVCWGGDLRRLGDEWSAFRISGANWQNDKALEVSMNSYRVLLTRARKGMVVFVPHGDQSGLDATRDQDFFNGTYEFLEACGGYPLV